jgi:hypothetical protein
MTVNASSCTTMMASTEVDVILLQSQLTLHPTTVQSFVTFGWNDFPIMETTTNHNTYHDDCTNISIIERTESRADRSATTAPMDETIGKTFPITNQTDCLLKKKKNTVRFSSQINMLEQIRYYDILLGDHPLCVSYPITFGWKYYDCDDVTIDSSKSHEDQYSNDEKQNNSGGSTTTLIINPLRSGISCSKSYCRRIPIQERRQRLSHSMGINTEQLDNLESIRQVSILYDWATTTK